MQYYKEPITAEQLTDFISRALYEDVRDGDHSALACIPADRRDKAVLKVKQDGVLAGVEVAKAVFAHLDASATVNVFQQDGARIRNGDSCLEVVCNTRALLQAERLVLNTMQRMSGIATASRRYADAIADLPVQLLDTRKTTPLLRFLEKYAVSVGGATNYRYGLYDRIMLKDNHIDAAGGVAEAIRRTVNYLRESGKNLEITVEIRNLTELQTALDSGVQVQLMLDNFDVNTLRKAVELVDKRLPTEASGGITFETLRDYASTGVDYISVGALTHSAGCLDLSLKVVKEA
ncbi:MAG: hypothetical protein RI894_1243 [Bacteroidota bacterium]|jgi:nicotinate-nucleotide pyrophosphorylase (carboxylating)